jgi:hypothetical protein
MRIWQPKCWQACRIDDCVEHSELFPDDMEIGGIHEMPIYVPSEEELANVGLKPGRISAPVSMDSSNSKVMIGKFQKRCVSQRGVLFSKQIIWHRIA